MNTQELVNSTAYRNGLSRLKARHIVDDLVSEIRYGLVNDGEARVPGLGTFEVVERPARTCRNPRTGEKIAVPAKRIVRFRPTASLKEALE